MCPESNCFSYAGDHAFAYNVANFFRALALPLEVEHWSLTTLREKLIKIDGLEAARNPDQGLGAFEWDEAAWAENLATWLIEQCLEILESAKASRNFYLANHALLTLARLGVFIEYAPDPALHAFCWILRVQANEAAANARKAARLRRCGARRKRDGQPCIATPLGNGRCKLHGGMSTGGM